jgi:hypothetical protein
MVMVVIVLVVFGNVDQPTVPILRSVLTGSGSGAACDVRTALLRRTTDETRCFLVRDGGRVGVEPGAMSARNQIHRGWMQYNQRVR